MINYIIVGSALFVIGLFGFYFVSHNLMIILMCIEVVLIAVNFNLLVFSVFLDDITGQILSLFILTVAAAESAIGLALLLVYYRLRGVIRTDEVKMLKG